MALGDPSPAEFIEAVLGDSDPREQVRRRGTQTGDGSERAWIRALANTLRSASADSARTADCLTDREIGTLVDGTAENLEAVRLAHLAACVRCCRRVAGVARLLNDDVVTAERQRIDAFAPGGVRRRDSLVPAAAGMALAAAALAGLLLHPGRSVDRSQPLDPADTRYRERAITTTAAPLILGPLGRATANDTLRWTSVVHADRYRVRVFDRAGTLVWDTQIVDTAVAIPARLERAMPASYLWNVQARTGWDRWVVSEWSELTIQARGGE